MSYKNKHRKTSENVSHSNAGHDFANRFHSVIPDRTTEGRADIIAAWIENLRHISFISNESYLLFDVSQKQILFVSNKLLLLAGQTPEDVMKTGYGHFQHVIYNDQDVSRYDRIYNIIVEYVTGLKEKSDREAVKYFSFQVRHINLKHPMMMCCKVRPVFMEGSDIMLLYSFSEGVKSEDEYFRLHYSNNEKQYSQYNFESRKWRLKDIPFLTHREKQVIMYAKQGMESKDIADTLYRAKKTIEKDKEKIAAKLDTSNILEAGAIAGNYDLFSIPDTDRLKK